MKILVRKFNVLVIVLVLSLDQICAQSTIKLTPIPEALSFGPKTHERLIVPVEPTNNNLIPIAEALVAGPKTHEKIIVPVEPLKKEQNIIVRRPIEIKTPSKVKLLVENPKIRRTNYNEVQHIPIKPIQNVNRYRDRNVARPSNSVQEMQPLHINMRGLNQSKPNHTRETVQEKKERFRKQEERIKMQKLPPNPTEVPRTTGFDNLGKYSYGIVHDYKYEDLPTLEDIPDAAGGESKEAVQSSPVPPPPVQTRPPEIKFRSSFRDPKIFATIHSENDNMGKFLYNTQVFYPSYRDHLYLPVTTFYGPSYPNTKDLPIFNTHTIVHNQPNTNVIEQPKNIPKIPPTIAPRKNPPVPARRYPTSPPKKYPPVPQKKSPPPKVNIPKQEPPKKLPPPPTKEEPKKPEEDYDYEEDDSEDDYDELSNDKQTDNTSNEEDEDYEEESSSESSEKKGKKSYKSRDDDEESEEDQFDKAWSKFGYGKNQASSESDSYESSESQNQPERVKIVHMKMEVHTTPLKDSDMMNSSEDEIKHDAKTLVNEPKKKRKNIVVTNSKPHPNAGPDDLKYFQ